MKEYCISDHCRFVRGSYGSAIYNFDSHKVNPIDYESTNVVMRALMGADITDDDKSILENFENKGWLNDHSMPIVEPHIRPKLRYAWLELTSRCNCKCLHCYGAFGSPRSEDCVNELSKEEWKTVIDNLAARGCNAVQFIGGEPLMHPHFTELVLYAKERGIKRIDVFTNAYLLSHEIVEVLQQANASIRVSLYGYDEHSHDSITLHPGSFSKLDHALTILKERGIPTTIAVVLMKENQYYLQQIKDYIKRKGFAYNGYDTVRPVKHSKQECHAVTDEELIRKRYICKPSFKTSAYQFALSMQWNNCWFGKLSITANGEVIPCIFARDLSCGNIRSDDWSMIRKRLLEYWSITKDSVDECKHCEFRYACHDCRPLAMGEGETIQGKYPRCYYQPCDGKWVGK